MRVLGGIPCRKKLDRLYLGRRLKRRDLLVSPALKVVDGADDSFSYDEVVWTGL
jgi:hypothetical protein